MKKENLKIAYEIFSVLLCVYVIVQLSLEIILDFSPKAMKIFEIIDFFVCAIFLGDWLFFFFQADHKGRYLKTHFVDLIASVPYASVLKPFRALRFFRLIRGLELLKGLRAMRPLMSFFFKNKARSALTIYLSITSLIYIYSSLGIYALESDVNAGLNNFGDAMWMCFTTLTSVGYGDIYPATGAGRVIAAILVITGMGLFGLVTGEVATIIIKHIQPNSNQN